MKIEIERIPYKSHNSANLQLSKQIYGYQNPYFPWEEVNQGVAMGIKLFQP